MDSFAVGSSLDTWPSEWAVLVQRKSDGRCMASWNLASKAIMISALEVVLAILIVRLCCTYCAFDLGHRAVVLPRVIG
jgi:hypothetical protein